MCVLGRLNGCLAAFTEVDDRVDLWEVRRCKRNKLYREYEEAVKLAKMILRRYDNSIDRASAEEHAIPAFWMLRGEQNGNTWASKMGKFKARPYSGFQ